MRPYRVYGYYPLQSVCPSVRLSVCLSVPLLGASPGLKSGMDKLGKAALGLAREGSLLPPRRSDVSTVSPPDNFWKFKRKMPPSPISHRISHRICINLRNDIGQKWSGHVHPSPPCGDATASFCFKIKSTMPSEVHICYTVFSVTSNRQTITVIGCDMSGDPFHLAAGRCDWSSHTN